MKDFERLFREITPEGIEDDVFTLAGKVFPVITAGKAAHYNSMTASGGGFGLLFRKPVTWYLIRSDRYTLELMLQERTNTLSYFPDEYKKQVLFLGSRSGRDSDKMREVELTAIQTPSGEIAFEEARLVIECELTQISTPGLDDFYTPEAQEYLGEEYKDPSHYRKYVFGTITHVWVKKKDI